MKIFDAVEASYPLMQNGVYPERLMGCLFEVSGCADWSYITKDAAMCISVKSEIVEGFQRIIKRAKDDNAKLIGDIEIVQKEMVRLQDVEKDLKSHQDARKAAEKMLTPKKMIAADLVTLAQEFTVEDIVRLRKKGLI